MKGVTTASRDAPGSSGSPLRRRDPLESPPTNSPMGCCKKLRITPIEEVVEEEFRWRSVGRRRLNHPYLEVCEARARDAGGLCKAAANRTFQNDWHQLEYM